MCSQRIVCVYWKQIVRACMHYYLETSSVSILGMQYPNPAVLINRPPIIIVFCDDVFGSMEALDTRK